MAISVGLNTVVRALLVQQQGIDVTSHNIANVGTPGYSRQRMHLAAIPPPAGVLAATGGGVEMLGIERIRDMFVDFQMRAEAHSAGRYSVKAHSLELAEIALGEPGESGLRSVMSGFWNSWRDLSNAPEQSAMRSAVVQAGSTLARAANRLYSNLVALQVDANARVSVGVQEINQLAEEIAGLNKEIVTLRAGGDPASDLTDRRDLALDRLARLVDVQYVTGETGRVDVFIGGRALVSGTSTSALTVTPNIANNNYYDVEWAADGEALRIGGGELQGLIEQRDTDLPGRLADLDTLMAQIIADVNAAHAAGYAQDGVTTGTAFFTGTGAADIAVNGALSGNLGLLAAATLPGAPGDGSNAIAISDLQFARNLTAGSESYGEFYNSFVTRLGVDARSAKSLAETQQLTIDHLEQLRQSASGVNLDEEMVNLVQFQRGYEAAARVIKVIDEMLDLLINGTI